MALNRNSFQDITANSGITWSRHRGNESFNVNWVDFNNDGLMDLWVIGHSSFPAGPRTVTGKFPALYINQGDGTFNNISTQYWRSDNGGDSHGTTWVDFDNDGDQDVLRIGGGALGGILPGQVQPNAFFVNDGQVNTNRITSEILNDQAEERNLGYRFARGRSSLWVDVNGDGRLDMIQLNGLRLLDPSSPSAYFEQKADGTFKNPVALKNSENLDIAPSRYAQLGDLTGDGSLEIVVQGTFEYPAAVFDISDGTLNNITDQFNNFPLTTSPIPTDAEGNPRPQDDFNNRTSARDSIIADFDNDGDNDFFLVVSDLNLENRNPSAFKAGGRVVVADLLNEGKEIGFSFVTDGEVAFDLADINEQAPKLNLPLPGGGNRILNFDASKVFIGASGRNPTAAELNAFLNSSSDTSNSFPIPNVNDPRLVLNSNSSGIAGLKADRSESGLYISYDANSQRWDVRLSSPGFEILRSIVESTTTVSDVQTTNFANPDFGDRALTNQLWTYDSNTGQFVDSSMNAGFNIPTLSQSAVAADFDNDKDLDIYVSNHYTNISVPNILYENNGDGTFRTVELAGGAAGGRIGPTHLDFNHGQRLAVADYDNNGFVDLFVSSSVLKSPWKTYLGTQPALYENTGNDNNWILLDLEGTVSNRDAIGAQVKLTSGGVTQLREQNGGIHAFAQNDQRLHFGLAQDNVIDRIEIRWPSGRVQVLENVATNQILEVREPGNLIGTNGNDNLFGTASGDRIFGLSGFDTLNGNGGNDTLRGGEGDDTIIGGDGFDVLREKTSGNITITSDRLFAKGIDSFSEIEVVNVDGADTNQTIDASEVTNLRVIVQSLGGRDTINGGSQNDIIVGGDDIDVITGGEGADIFLYQNIGHRNDIITDFEPGTDKIRVSASGFGGGLTPGEVADSQFVLGFTPQDSSDRFLYNADNGRVLFDPDGTGAAGKIVIATLSDRPDFTQDDIEIVA